MERLLTSLFTAVALTLSTAAIAQNIVPNPDLETYTTCPTGITQVDVLVGWNKIPNHTGSADCINACNNTNVDVPNNAFGNQNAHSGVGYFGFASYYQSTPQFREYTYCTFTTPMVAGTTYDISFWVSLADNSQFGSDNALQIYFSNTVVSGTGGNWNPITTINPQIINTIPITDKNNWVQVAYQYTAAGGEQYMTLGNFDNDVATNTIPAGGGSYSTVYYYVDDFIVEPVTVPCDPSWTTLTVCSTDPVVNLNTLITGDTGGTWSGTGVTGNTFNPASGTSAITYTAPGGCDLTQTITVNPTAVATWTIPSNLCDSDAPFDLNTFITGTAGGTWSGTGVTGSTFDPSVGTQSITYTAGTAPCDDAVTQTITVGTQADATWTPPANLCTSGAPVDLNTTITGTAGGTWSGTGVTGSMFDPSVGSQSITYTVGTAPCDDVSTQTINVGTTTSAAWTIPTGLCDGDAPFDLSTFITGDVGGTWSGTGVTGTMFDPSVGTQSITYTVGVAPCDDAVNQTITVGTQASAAWTPPTGLCLAAPTIDLNTTITGTTGGTWSGTGVTGSIFDPSVGTQTITYTVGTAPCDSSFTQTINVAANPDAAWTVPAGLCIGDAPIDLTTLITGSAGGTWSGTGITGSMFDPSVGSQTVTYSVGTAPCDATSAQLITVANALDASWAPPIDICESNPPFDLSTLVTGDPGGTWSGTGVTGNMFDPSLGTQSLTYTVGAGGCQDVSTQTFTVNTAPDASWTTLTTCISSSSTDLNAQITGLAGGTWSGNGVSGNTFDPSSGTQTITYSVSAGGCTSTSSQTITVLDPTPVSAPTHVTCFGFTDGSITTNVTGGSGNYTYAWNPSGQTTSNPTNLAAGTYELTVTDVDAGCTVTETVTVLEPTEIELTMAGLDACSPEFGVASVTATGGTGTYSYNWPAFGNTTNTVTDVDSALATVVVTDANGCVGSDSVFVNVWPLPITTITNDTTIVRGDFIMLNTTGGVTYEWTPSDNLSCDDCPMPVATPEDPTTYCVEITDTRGCKVEECVFIDIEIICGEVFVPSAFSPNDDGENDELCVYSDCLDNFVFIIYNRWGEKVYETHDQQICWDGSWKGKQLNSAVFVYTLDGVLINGQTLEQKGNISLIR